MCGCMILEQVWNVTECVVHSAEDSIECVGNSAEASRGM